MTDLVIGSCHHDCPDTCLWEVTVKDGVAIKLRGSKDHPTTRGQLCPKVNRLLHRVYNDERILTPLRRTVDGFLPISWDEALAEIADQVRHNVARSGAESILQFSFDGTQGVIQKGIVADRFFDVLGASDVERDLCGVTAWHGAAAVSGEPFGVDPEDLVHSKNIILWGTNTYLTNRHLWPVIEEARGNGATVTVIDPIRTSTAERADTFIQIKPGTDVALVLAMIHVLDRDGLLDQEWLNSRTNGWSGLRTDAAMMTPADASVITGISSGQIVDLAQSYVANTPSAIRVLVGPEHRRYGEDIMRAIALLPAITGAWREVGGGLVRSTQIYFEHALNYPDRSQFKRRSFSMSQLGAVLNNPGLDPAIGMLLVHNSNPAVVCPDQNAVIAGLERDDLFTVVIEQFMTDTAQHADIVLPCTTQIEHMDLGIAWGHLNLALNQPAIEPIGEALPNTEIFRRLAARLDMVDPLLTQTDEELVRGLLDSDHPWLEGISFDSLDKQGWQRLAIEPGTRPFVDSSVPAPVAASSVSSEPAVRTGSTTGRIHRFELGSLRYQWPKSDSAFPLGLLSRKQHLKFLNSNYAGFDAHLPTPPEPLLSMHVADAVERGLSEGDQVRVFNERGELNLRVQFSADTQPGLVTIPFGWWNRHTSNSRGVNALTASDPQRAGRGSASFHDTRVEVEKK